MAATSLTDIFVPEVFTPAVTELTTELLTLWQSGVIRKINDIPIGRGKIIDLPFYQDLSGDDEVWSDTSDVTLNNISESQDTAAVLTRLKAWGSTDLAEALGQDDPMDTIMRRVANYWARKYQTALLSTVNGAISGFNTLDISAASSPTAANEIDGASFVDATQVLGDHAQELTDMVVHSAVESSLRKQDLIDFIPDSEGKFTIRTFQGRRLHVYDGMPNNSGIYTTYLFAQGAVGFVEETVEEANEVWRHPERNGGTDALYTRRKLIMHPRGVRWTPASGIPANATPSNTELEDSGNYTRVYDPKNIKIVKFVHNVA